MKMTPEQHNALEILGWIIVCIAAVIFILIFV